MKNILQNIRTPFTSFFWHLMQLPFHLNCSWQMPFPLSLQVKISGRPYAQSLPLIVQGPFQLLLRDNRKKQSKYKRFLFSQSPTFHPNKNSKQQFRFLPHIFLSQKFLLVKGPPLYETFRDYVSVLTSITLMPSVPLLDMVRKGGYRLF